MINRIKLKLIFSIRSILKQLLPPLAINICKYIFKKKKIYFVSFQSWEQAELASEGYDNISVFDLNTNTLTNTITIGDGQRGIIYDTIYDRMYVAIGYDDTVKVLNT